MITKNCKNCKKEFQSFVCHKRIFCSLSCRKKGYPSPLKGRRDLFPIGEFANNWKGDNVGYHGIHKWVQLNFGKPSKCERCQTMNAKRYEWANISRKYKRDINDWQRLCVTCHRLDGIKNGEYPEPWNKGTKGLMPIPWNKGLKII